MTYIFLFYRPLNPQKCYCCIDYLMQQLSSLHLPLQWRHNGHDGVSNHQSHHCLLNRLFGRRSKKISKLRVTGLCAGISPGTAEFPAQIASNAENVSIGWRLHVWVSYRSHVSWQHLKGIVIGTHIYRAYQESSSRFVMFWFRLASVQFTFII